MTRFNRNRRGLSLMETMFALGVLLVGLLGITAVLSTAGKQAVDSRVLAASQSIAHGSLGSGYARDIENPVNWCFWDGTPSPPAILPPAWRGVPLAPNYPSPLPFDSSASFCLDPIGLTSQTPTPIDGDSQFDRSLFPYYKPVANPLLDPSLSIGALGSLQWSSMARMTRITLGSRTSPVNAIVIGAKRAEQIFASSDELSVLTSKSDRSVPATLGFELGDASSAGLPVPLGKPSTKQEFSWFATFTPNENSTVSNPLYTMSIVVVRNRDRALEIPPPSNAGLQDAKRISSGETIAWVAPMGNGVTAATGFQGGGGGRALLITSPFVETHIASGQWIMLSRVVGSGASARPIFGWYRVSYVDPDPVLIDFDQIQNQYQVPNTWSDPFGNSLVGTQVAVREVHLAGRDWSLVIGPGNATTTATIVRGAVNVHERIISLAMPAD